MNKTTLVLIVLLAIGGYKYFSDSIGITTSQEASLSNKVTSEPYKFQASFHKKPAIETTVVKIPVMGRLKTTNYAVKDKDLWCNIIVVDYLDVTDSIGSFDEVAAGAENASVKKLGGKITDSRYLKQDGTTGYEYTLLTKNTWRYKSRLFMKFNNLYTVSCFYKNDQFVQQTDDFLESFMFI